MRGFVLLTLTALFASTIGLPPVVRFSSELESQQEVRLQAYKFTNCLPADKEEAVVNSLIFTPDPLVFPGPLGVSFDVSFKENVNAPLKAVVYLGKKVGSTWIKIPCIGQIGSCTYDDLCSILAGIDQCPDPFIAAGVPCKCPFNKGSYKLPKANFDVEAAIFPPGDYHGQANLTMNGDVIGCYDILATFS